MAAPKMDLSANANPKVDTANFRGMNTATTLDELVQHYDNWAPNYDQEVSTYGHKKHLVVDEIKKIVGDRRDVKILDLAAGTGIGGELLKKEAFTNIDALDASQEMLNVAEQKGIYKNLICAYVVKETPLPIENDTYDFIAIFGGVGSNHIREDCFEDLARILVPGGSIINITPVHAYGSELDLFESTMRRNEANNILSWVENVSVPDYVNGTDGILQVFKKPILNKL